MASISYPISDKEKQKVLIELLKELVNDKQQLSNQIEHLKSSKVERSLRDRAASESSSNRERSILFLFLDIRDGIYQTLDIGIRQRSYRYSNVSIEIVGC